MEQTPKSNPENMSNTAFLNSISEEKVGFTPPRETKQTGGKYLRASLIGDGYSNPLKLRLLGTFMDGKMIAGWRAFRKSGTPNRKRKLNEIDLTELGTNNFGKKEEPVEFWAVPVYVFDDQTVQIFEIHQQGIMNGLEKLGNDRSWGDFKHYNITIQKSGAGNRTAYTVNAIQEDFPQDQQNFVYESIQNIDMEKLFVGEEPFLRSDENAQTQ